MGTSKSSRLTPSQADNSGQWATTEFTNLKISSLIASKNTWTNENKFDTLLTTKGLLNDSYLVMNSIDNNLTQVLSGSYVYAYSFEEIITINLPDNPTRGTTYTIYNAGTFKINIQSSINNGFEGMYLVRDGTKSILLQNGAYITLYFRGAWIVVAGSCTVLSSTLVDNQFTGTQTFTNLNAKETISINKVNIDDIYSPLNNTVDLKTNQNIDGIKNFSTCPVLPDNSISDTYLSSNVGLLNKDNTWLGINTVKTPETTSDNDQIATTSFVKNQITQIQTINSTYSRRYTSTTTIELPSNCFKMDMSCISRGGKAGNKIGSTYGGAGGGGGFVKLSNFLIMSGTEPTYLYVKIYDDYGKIEVKLLSLEIITIEPGGDGINAINDKGSPVPGGAGSQPIIDDYLGGTFICYTGTYGGPGGASTLAPYPGTITGCCNPGNSGIGQRDKSDLVYSSTSIVIVTYYLYN